MDPELNLALGAIYERLKTETGDLAILAEALPHGELRADNVDDNYEPDACVISIIVPATARFSCDIPELEEKLWPFVRDAYFPDWVVPVAVRVRFRPSVEDWRRSSADAVQRSALTERYHIRELLGEGQFARVYSATNKVNDAEVAVKVFKSQQSALEDEQARLRMVREVRTLARLEHPNIIPILDFGQDEQVFLWYTMPIAGQTLRADVTGRKWTADEILIVLNDLANAVDYFHISDVVHRDLKPSNILRLDGRWVVSDFGLTVNRSRESTILTGTGWGLGSWGYRPPEFDSAREAEPAWDVYSLGQIAWDLISGRSYAEREAEAAPKHIFMPAITRACAATKQERFESAGEFVAECERLLAVSTSRDWESPADTIERLCSQLSASPSVHAVEDLLAVGDFDDIEFLYRVGTALVSVEEASVKAIANARPELAERFFSTVLGKFPYEKIPFKHLDHVADFLLAFEKLGDDYTVRCLRWLAEHGSYWNQFYVIDRAAELGARVASSQAHLLKPALDGLQEYAIETAIPDLTTINPAARPTPAVID